MNATEVVDNRFIAMMSPVRQLMNWGAAMRKCAVDRRRTQLPA
jgi:hypothetical protein